MTSFTGFCFSDDKALGDFGALRFEGAALLESGAGELSGVEVAKTVGTGMLSTLSVIGGDVVCANAIGESKHKMARTISRRVIEAENSPVVLISKTLR